ncbi:hypothetical protein OAC96_06245, partial [Candidatus Pelagibacter sp.]|nr:hypothetical protein [Candidatus Pelagibacter sp.]
GVGPADPSKLNFSLSQASSLENAGTTITLTVTSDDPVASNTIINFGLTGTATSGTDYSISQNYITIPSGSKTATQTFTITDDSVYEGDETIIFTSSIITGDSTYTSESTSINFTITENESAPTVTLTSSASSIAENAGSSLTLTATLSGATDEAVTVGISTSGTGTEGTDYGTISDITISAGSTTGTTSFTPTDDTTYEGNETGIIAIDTVTGGSATENGTQSVTLTITENESAPTVTLTSSASSIAENAGTSLTLTATLSGATDEAVTVGISTSGTGTEGTDYGTVSDITILAGATTGTATFTPTDDTTYEGNETGIIAIDTVTGGSATENGTQSVTLTITENESAPTVTLTSSASSIAENAGSSLTLTATLSVATTANVTVGISTSGTGTEGADYATVSDITILAGATTGTATFTPTDDSTFEGDETGIIAIDTVTGGSATENGTQSVTITINEDDSGPAFSISNVTTSNENAANATFTVTMSTTSSATATVDYATSNGTATASSDYTSSSGTLTFSPGDTSKTFTVPVLADTIYEGNETATITLSNAVNATISSSTATLTITDDESAPTVTLTSSASSVAENGSALTLTATLSVATTANVTVGISTSGTGTEGTDYGTVSDITITAGQTTGTTSFTPTDDTTYEGNETGIIAIDTVSGGSATENGNQSVTITITENENAPTVTLTSSASSIAENAGSSLTLTATLSVATTANVTVGISTSGTGTEGTDYGTVSDITITAGSTTGTAIFTPTDDTTYEGNETGIIAIDTVSGGSATENGTQSVTLTITENESTPTVTLTSSASSIAENAGSSLTLTATLSVATTANVTVGISTSGTGTEGSGGDYATISNITITAGQTTGTTTFTPTDDSTFEGNETAIIDIDSVSGGSASENGTQRVTITINEDDSGPALSINDFTTSNENAANATFTVTMSTTSSSTVTVDYATSNGTATASSDYTAASGTLTFSAGDTSKTFNVPVLADTVYETGNETVTITLSNATNATISDSTGILTITDDDNAPTVTLTSSASSVAENGSNLTLTATLSNATTADVSVGISTTGTGTEGTDYATVSDITISAGATTGTAAFNPTDDSVYEGDETGIIAIDTVSGGSATENSTPQAVTLTISENESAPTVSLSSTATSVYDNGSNITFTATSTVAADEDITVAISDHTGTATPGTDFGAITSITISAGATTGTATFNPTSDTVNEGSETAIIAIASVSGADSSTSGTTSITVTITEYALRTETAFADDLSDATTPTSVAGTSGYSNIDTTSGRVHTYTQMRINEIIPYTDGTNLLTGEGEVIHIADFNCNTNMDIFDSSNRTIWNIDDGDAGESTFANDTLADHHCNSVVTFAVGKDTGGSDNIPFYGVAPDADLVLSSIPDFQGTYAVDDFADDLDFARGKNAIASNNSWTAMDSATSAKDASEFQTIYDNNKASFTMDQLVGFYLEGDASVPTAQTTATQEYITALDNFQNNGVIVFANGNFVNDSDASFVASLPVWYNGGTDDLGNSLEDLSDAWITVLYADFTGSDMVGITESEFSRKGNPCGKAREFCLTVDDFGVNNAGWYNESTGANNYQLGTNGSSFGAPMISGGIALLAQAFPNHTPEQLTDRLLASANNSWFTASGSTTFTTHGASIRHGYNDTWGHGLPDFKAALSPITSNANPASFMLGQSLSSGYANSGERHTLSSSSLSLSSALANSGLAQGISGTKAYFYDALAGGFEYDLSNIVYDKGKENYLSKVNPVHQLQDLRNYHTDQKFSSPEMYQGEYINFKDDNNTGLSVSINNPNVAAQKFNLFEQSNYQGDDFMKVKGLSLNNFASIGDSNLVISYSNSSIDPILEKNDSVQSIMASLDLFPTNGNKNLILTTGAVLEQDTLLFTKSSGAMNLGNEETMSNIFGVNYQKSISDNSDLTFNSLLTYTAPKQFENSLVNKTDNLYTSRFNINYNLKNIFTE